MLDFDGDGRPDLFFAQGGTLVVGKDRDPLADVLLRNLGGGRFEDVSAAEGLDDYGHPSFREALDRFVASAADEAQLTSMGWAAVEGGVRAAVTEPGLRVASATDEHFRRSASPADNEPDPQTSAIADRVSARLASLRHLSRSPGVFKLKTISPGSPKRERASPSR